MIFPSFRRINKTDFKQELQETIEKLAVTINNGFEVIYEALRGKLSLKDNILCTIKTINVEVLATGVPKGTTVASYDFEGRVEGVLVLSVNNLTNSNVYPSGGVFVSYTPGSKNISINNITGLAVGYNWQLKLVILGS